MAAGGGSEESGSWNVTFLSALASDCFCDTASVDPVKHADLASSSSMFAFLRSFSMRDGVRPDNKSSFACIISSSDISARRRLFSASTLSSITPLLLRAFFVALAWSTISARDADSAGVRKGTAWSCLLRTDRESCRILWLGNPVPLLFSIGGEGSLPFDAIHRSLMSLRRPDPATGMGSREPRKPKSGPTVNRWPRIDILRIRMERRATPSNASQETNNATRNSSQIDARRGGQLYGR